MTRSTLSAQQPGETTPDTPALTEKARAAKAAREARLAEALRANLRRRKDQARSRELDAKPEEPD